jgi:hypothetical protein
VVSDRCWQECCSTSPGAVNEGALGLSAVIGTGHGSVQDWPSFSIRRTPGADRKLPLPASFVILVAVPLYSPVDGSLQGHEISTESGSAGGIDPGTSSPHRNSDHALGLYFPWSKSCKNSISLERYRL